MYINMCVVCERREPGIYPLGKKGRGYHIKSYFHFTKIRTIHFTEKETKGPIGLVSSHEAS